MGAKSAKFHCLIGGLTAMIAMVSLEAPRAEAADGLFSHLAGYWAGNGTISLNNGTSERIRCKASYAVGGGGNAVEQSLRCASESYNLQISANVVSRGGSISGTWTEATRGVSGNISGSATASDIRASVAGPTFTAGLSLATKGDRQSVSIRPQGATDITGVSISMRKE